MHPSNIHSRVDLACEQLDVAINLFLERTSLVSALTLAGAAEEILGIEVKNMGKTNELSRRHEELSRLLPRAGLQAPTPKEYRNKENDARNAAKHIADKTINSTKYDQFLRGNLSWEATKMISRAIANARILALPESEAWRRFNSWSLEQMSEHEEP
jgi:hypothetical protein